MTPDTATTTVLDYVKKEWAAASFSLPTPSAATPTTTPPRLFLEAEPFELPKDPPTVCARALVRHGAAKQRTMGVARRKFETDAVLELQLFAPPGDAAASVIAALVGVARQFLDGKRVPDVSELRPFRPAQVRRSAINGRQAFAIVEFPFSYTERK